MRGRALAYLVQLAISTVEDELDGDVRTVLHSLDVGGADVDRRTKGALAGRLEVVHDHLVLPLRVREVGKVVRVWDGRDDHADCRDGERRSVVRKNKSQ